MTQPFAEDGGHPSPDDLAKYWTDQLAEGDELGMAISKHLEKCEECRQRNQPPTIIRQFLRNPGPTPPTLGLAPAPPTPDAQKSALRILAKPATAGRDRTPGPLSCPEEDWRRRHGHRVQGRGPRGRTVAVKVMLAELPEFAKAKERFIREAKTAATVTDVHIVGVYDVNEDHVPPFLVMEFVEGTSLEALLKKRGHLDGDEFVKIAVQTLGGLAVLHDKGLIHRDIKPANILIDESGCAKNH